MISTVSPDARTSPDAELSEELLEEPEEPHPVKANPIVIVPINMKEIIFFMSGFLLF